MKLILRDFRRWFSLYIDSGRRRFHCNKNKLQTTLQYDVSLTTIDVIYPYFVGAIVIMVSVCLSVHTFFITATTHNSHFYLISDLSEINFQFDNFLFIILPYATKSLGIVFLLISFAYSFSNYLKVLKLY